MLYVADPASIIPLHAASRQQVHAQGFCLMACLTAARASALDKQSAVMEEEQLEERNKGIHGDANSRRQPHPIVEGDENGLEANGGELDGVTQVLPFQACPRPVCWA